MSEVGCELRATSCELRATSGEQLKLRIISAILLLALGTAEAKAQDQLAVESLAGVLAAADARRFTGPLFRAAARHGDPLVRRHAALAMGRIGNPAALTILLRLSSDPDTSVQGDAVFAMGLLGSTDAVDRLRDILLNTPSNEQGLVQVEAVAALARIGGPEARSVVLEFLNRWVGIAPTDAVPLSVERAVGEVWRFGNDSPLPLLAQFGDAAAPGVRWRAVYSMGRVGAGNTSNALLLATGDSDPLVRAFATQALSADFADRAQVDRRGIAARVRALVSDPDPHVRISALRALGTYASSDNTTVVVDRTADTHPNVRVVALRTLGSMQGQAVVDALSRALVGGIFATRREALLALTRVTGARALPTIGRWMGQPDWRDRSTAAEALALFPPSISRERLEALLQDEDERVVAAALQAALQADSSNVRALASRFARHTNPVLRSIAAIVAARLPDTTLLRAQVDALAAGRDDRHPAASVRTLQALGAMVAAYPGLSRPVQGNVLAAVPSTDSYLLRRAAANWLPMVADRWGPAHPIVTGRGIADYRDLAREVVMPTGRGQLGAELVVETERGSFTMEVSSPDSPLSAQSFMRLVDRRHFDGAEWYEVEPGELVYAGGARNAGLAESFAPIRDEPNRRTFGRGAVGIVRDGADSGGSRFFVTQRPQPELEGTHTLIGRVTSGQDVVDRISRGDRIRRIRRR